MTDNDISQSLCERVQEASETRTSLAIRGGSTKAFYGRTIRGEPLEVAGHRGIISYEPSELVITARAGTPLSQIQEVLAERGQMLPFEPPAFGDNATLGGTVACGLSGPRRPYAGACRDFVLGMTLLNGRGEILKFGGQVMKNVAGYDLSRLNTGALGTLGVILEISLKVLPLPAGEATRVLDMTAAQAIESVNRWAGRPLPLSAAAHDGRQLLVRLSGAASAVAAAAGEIGGEEMVEGPQFWKALAEQHLSFFDGGTSLWRLAVAPATPPLDLPGEQLVDWGGALRWLKSDASPDTIRAVAGQAGGHATMFRGGDREGEVFQPLDPVLARLHRNLKASFDPKGILNPGRFYSDL